MFSFCREPAWSSSYPGSSMITRVHSTHLPLGTCIRSMSAHGDQRCHDSQIPIEYCTLTLSRFTSDKTQFSESTPSSGVGDGDICSRQTLQVAGRRRPHASERSRCGHTIRQRPNPVLHGNHHIPHSVRFVFSMAYLLTAAVIRFFRFVPSSEKRINHCDSPT